MNIKEIELQTGMPRANIRYYEAEGLLTPQRKENGYREYSTEDADTLLKIRLLRSMDVSLDEIRRMQAGELSLQEMALQQMERLSERRNTLDSTLAALRQLLDRGEAFDTLDAVYYLQLLEVGFDSLKSDAVPRLNLPWRRYWGRMFDLELYHLITRFFMRDFLLRDMLTGIFSFVTMLLVEPLLLYLFGTIPGKAIFGIHVSDPEERRLGYGTGLERTWMVLLEGMALNIPLIGWYFQYKSLRFVENGEMLSWEQDSEMTYKDDAMWRFGLCAAAYGLLLVLNWVTVGGAG